MLIVYLIGVLVTLYVMLSVIRREIKSSYGVNWGKHFDGEYLAMLTVTGLLSWIGLIIGLVILGISVLQDRGFDIPAKIQKILDKILL